MREKEVKSGKASAIALPSFAVDELRRWRAAQAVELLRLGIGADDSRHVVTQADGSPLQPRSLTHIVSAFLKEWGVTLHKLRHSHASHMRASNVHPKSYMNGLGIPRSDYPGYLFAHIPNMQGGAAATVDG